MFEIFGNKRSASFSPDYIKSNINFKFLYMEVELFVLQLRALDL